MLREIDDKVLKYILDKAGLTWSDVKNYFQNGGYKMVQISQGDTVYILEEGKYKPMKVIEKVDEYNALLESEEGNRKVYNVDYFYITEQLRKWGVVFNENI